MAIRGSEAANNSSSIHEGKNVTVRRRRRGSGSNCGVKRRASAASLKCLVDYSCKQANLSANSLLRLQTLVEGEKPSLPRQPRRLSAIQLENDEFASFEDSVTSHEDITSSVHKPLSPTRQQPRTSPVVCPRSPIRRCSSGSINSNVTDPLAGDSEHSINLDKVFESLHNKTKKAEQATCCISVTISDDQDKIKFSLRNPEILKTLRKALNEQPESEDTDEEEVAAQPQSATTTTNFKPLRREIKCVIPHDRFQLPQMQVFRPKPEPQSSSSHHNTKQTSAPRISNSLHCIDEASEYGDVSGSLAASKASMQSSIDSFAGDSSVDDDSVLSKASKEAQERRASIKKEASERSERMQSLRIEEAEDEDEGEESDSDKEHQPPVQEPVPTPAQPETVEDEPSEAEEIDSQLDVFSQSEAETQNASEREAITKQQTFVKEVSGYPRLNPYSSLDDDEDESESDTERDMDTLIGLYMNDDTVRYSIAESTIAESLVEELTEVGDDEESICTTDVVQYADDSLTDHNNEDSLNQIGNSSQTGAGYGDSQSVVLYESESDHAYDGDNTEAGDESYATLGGCDMSFSPAALLGADTDEEEESADEYEEDMEEEEEEIRDEAEDVESAAPRPKAEESDAESEREAAESDGSHLTNATDDSSHHNAMTRGLSVYLSSHSRAGNNSGASLLGSKKNSNNMMKDGHDSNTATSITHSMSTAFPSLDASNQSSIMTSGTNRSAYTNNSGYTNSSGYTIGSAYTNSTASSTRSLRSHLTSRTSRSAPTELFRQDSISSMKSSRSELDESGHSRKSFKMEDLSLSRQSSRASSAPNEDSYRRRGRRYSNLLSADSQLTEASKSNFFFNSDDDSTVASAVDHRRRRRPRRSVTGDMLPLQRQSSGRSSRSARIRRDSIKPSKSAIIPRSNTPQGTFLRTHSRDSLASSSRASAKSDRGPKLPPRTLSRDKSENSNMNGEPPRRRAPRRSSSMGMGASSTGTGRSLPQRTKSRESFMGGSRIKKWDGSTANRSGHGLSLLERHLNNGGKKQPMKRQPPLRRSSIASSKGHNSFVSIPSLIQSLPKEV